MKKYSKPNKQVEKSYLEQKYKKNQYQMNKETKKFPGKLSSNRNQQKRLKVISRNQGPIDVKRVTKNVKRDKTKQTNKPQIKVQKSKQKNLNPQYNSSDKNILRPSISKSNKQNKNKNKNGNENEKGEAQRSMQLTWLRSLLSKIRLNISTIQLRNECQYITRQLSISKGNSILSLQLQQRISKFIQALPDRFNNPPQQAQQQPLLNPKAFVCNILYQYQDYRQYLFQVFDKQCGKVSKTQLVYRYDIYNKANIHNYIDNKERLLFVIQTHQDFMIAAYTESPFQSKTFPIIGKSFIVSLTNRRYFTKINNKKSISYDPIYVVFGNSDIRIKGNELFSNFGVNNSSYDSRGQRSNGIFGEGSKNITEIKEMEVFQVSFEQ